MLFHITYYFIHIYFLFLRVPFPPVYIQFLPLRLFLFAVHHTIPCHIIFPFLSLSVSHSPASLAAHHLVSPFPKGNPLTPLFPQCDTVLEFSTTFSICYRDSAKVPPLYGNKGLRHTLTRVECSTHIL